MNKIIDIVEKQTEKAILVSVDTGEFDAQISIDELEELAQTAGLDVIAQVIQKKTDDRSRNLCRRRKA